MRGCAAFFWQTPYPTQLSSWKCDDFDPVSPPSKALLVPYCDDAIDKDRVACRHVSRLHVHALFVIGSEHERTARHPYRLIPCAVQLTPHHLLKPAPLR